MSFFFQIHFSIEVSGWSHFLNKEENKIRIIAKIVMLFEKGTRCGIIFITCHDQKRDPCICSLLYIHQIIDQTLKDKEFFC